MPTLAERGRHAAAAHVADAALAQVLEKEAGRKEWDVGTQKKVRSDVGSGGAATCSRSLTPARAHRPHCQQLHRVRRQVQKYVDSTFAKDFIYVRR